MAKNKSTKPKVKKGVENVVSLNPKALERQRQLKKEIPDWEVLLEGIRKKDRYKLSQAITLIESKRLDHQAQAQKLLNACLPLAGKATRIGITGTPGVGKSTFIEAFGQFLITMGNSVAVLTVDPSSQLTKGSILGDKTRMATLGNMEEAFIRPTSAGSSLGGVAQRTRESMILCEAAGYDIILVETVGVGQSEITVHSMVDFFLLLLLPGAGDELQGIKRGIVEMADLIAINKADGENLQKAKLAKASYSTALHLFPPKASGWSTKLVLVSAIEKTGLDSVFEIIDSYKEAAIKEGHWDARRRDQNRYWFEASLREELLQNFRNNEDIKKMLPDLEKQIDSGKLSPFRAAKELVAKFLGKG